MQEIYIKKKDLVLLFSVPMDHSKPMLPLGRRSNGLFFPPSILLSLLTLFAVQTLANPHRGDGHYITGKEPGAGAKQKAPGREDGCRGFWDICCQPSSSSLSSSLDIDDDRLFFTQASYTQVPIDYSDDTPHGSQKKKKTNVEGTSSKLAGHAMNLIQPLLSLAVSALCSPPPTSTATTAKTSSVCAASTNWPGFSGLRYAFTFGDSYTTTWFNFSLLPHPSPSNPLGNPPYPGYTSANGPNWVDYFTVQYNHSLIQTYNLAVGGASIGSGTLPPNTPTYFTLKGQVHDIFIPGYYEDRAPGAPDWNGRDSVFAIWMGINDVGGSYMRGPAGPDGTDALNERIFAEYAELVDDLYNHGARNFVFLNIPAIERSPLTVGRGPRDVTLQKAHVEAVNGRITDMAWRLKQKFDGVNVWVYDTHADFSKVIDNPGAFPQTSRVKNTTDVCEDYQS